MDCPKCIGKLETKDLTVSQVSGDKALQGAGISYTLEYNQCFVCGGVWFDKGELEKYTSEKLSSIEAPLLGAELDKEFIQKQGKCPKCSVILKRTPYKQKPSITLDTCGQCDGVWLDPSEIDKIDLLDKEPGFLETIMRRFRRSDQ